MVSRSTVFRQFAEYRQIAGIDEIGRRYVAMNAFDGILTLIGVLMGAYVAGVTQSHMVLSMGLATCIAMGVSGFSGAYMAESAERKSELQRLEQALLRDLKRSKQARASRFAVIAIALINGLSPLLAALIVLTPFLFGHLWSDIIMSYAIALGIALLMLFGLGAFQARVARENAIYSGARMIFAGAMCVLLSFVLNNQGKGL